MQVKYSLFPLRNVVLWPMKIPVLPESKLDSTTVMLEK